MAAEGNSMLRPRDAADVAEIVRAHPRALEPMGGGSKRSIGRPVDADPLDLAALSGITEYEPAELVLTARAATPIPAIREALAANGQRLAFEPPDFAALLHGDGVPTLGGVLSANVSGSRRVSAGAARDHFLGCRAVAGSGEEFRAGGKVVKNVTGYDLPKLLAGSWGTLAVLTEVTVRVAPAPETETTLVIEADDAANAVEMLTAALASSHDVSAAAYDPARGCLLRLEGFGPSVAARAAGVLEALRPPGVERLDAVASSALWSDLGSAAALAERPFVWRIGVPPSDAPRVLDAIAPRQFLLDWGGGLIWAALDELDVGRVRGALPTGHATLWKAPVAERSAAAVFQPQPAGVAAIAARVRAALDPAGKLNPGRMA
ncbi:MAG: FAD-binding protein [Gammaproteobacteria bacterium]|nr:FAD-binding protein [Gammaproteobacteria bacterium]